MRLSTCASSRNEATYPRATVATASGLPAPADRKDSVATTSETIARESRSQAPTMIGTSVPISVRMYRSARGGLLADGGALRLGDVGAVLAAVHDDRVGAAQR